MAGIARYYWSFGDGRYSTAKNPLHVYMMPGVYTVILTYIDVATEKKTGYIVVTDWDYAGGLNVSSTNRCLRYSMQPSQGFGWSEYGGDAWPFPEARVGTLKIIDSLERERMLVFDRRSGRLQEIGVRDQFVDASDGDYGGYEIACRLEFREEIGSARHYFLRSIEHHPEFVPHDENNKGEDGYTAAGFRAAMQVKFSLRKDGSATDTMVTRDIPLDGDITFKYDDEAHRWQPIVETTTSEWRLVGSRNYYERLDKPAEPDKLVMSEQTYQVQLANMAVHCGRQSLAYSQNASAGTLPALMNFATGNPFTGTYSGFVSGPDGRGGSGITFNGTQGIVTASTVLLAGDFAVMFWAKDPDGTAVIMDQVGGFVVTLVEIGGNKYELRFSDSDGNEEDYPVNWNKTDWALFTVQRNGTLFQMYHNSQLILSRDVPEYVTYSGQVRIMNNSEGQIFEPRLINNAVSAGAVQHHYEDATKHSGKATCAFF